jgi:hypothetical protein
MLGLYPPSSNNNTLWSNQTSEALPPFNISNEILEKADQELGNFALPYNL